MGTTSSTSSYTSSNYSQNPGQGRAPTTLCSFPGEGGRETTPWVHSYLHVTSLGPQEERDSSRVEAGISILSKGRRRSSKTLCQLRLLAVQTPNMRQPTIPSLRRVSRCATTEFSSTGPAYDHRACGPQPALLWNQRPTIRQASGCPRISLSAALRRTCTPAG